MRRRRPVSHTHDGLAQRARRGLRGYPVATIAYYGPDDKFASKVVVGVILEEGGEAAFLERWFSHDVDIRLDTSVNKKIFEFMESHQVQSVIMVDRIFGCPHEEGIDYPDGEKCPQCPYWATHDRYTGESIP